MASDDDDDNDSSSSSSYDSYNDEGQLTSSTKLLEIIENIFPLENIVYVFGYGSGVFSQDDDKNKMIDIILVVDDAYEFHSRNIQKNSNHYSSILRHTNTRMIVNLQRNFILRDGKVLFHVVDDDDTPKMKYGIIHIDDLCQDLIQWESLYIAGRLHKPTLPLVLSSTSSSSSNSSSTISTRIDEAQHINLQAAVSSALLLSSEEEETSKEINNNNNNIINNIPFTKFYSHIAGISYGGDFRMKVGGEDPHKISKLVTGNTQQIQRFHNMYMSQILQPLEQIGIISIENNNNNIDLNGKNNGSISWNPYDVSARNHLIGKLPKKIQSQIIIPTTGSSSSSSSSNTIAVDRLLLPKILANIVSRPARNQSMKGILTLGFRKSIQYATAKLSKGGGFISFFK